MGQMVGGAAQGFSEAQKPFDLTSIMSMGGNVATMAPTPSASQQQSSVPQLNQQATVEGDNPYLKQMDQTNGMVQDSLNQAKPGALTQGIRKGVNQAENMSQMGAGQLIDHVGQMFGAKPLQPNLVSLGNAAGSGDAMAGITQLLGLFGL
jgi:hypothetical protein